MLPRSRSSTKPHPIGHPQFALFPGPFRAPNKDRSAKHSTPQYETPPWNFCLRRRSVHDGTSGHRPSPIAQPTISPTPKPRFSSKERETGRVDAWHLGDHHRRRHHPHGHMVPSSTYRADHQAPGEWHLLFLIYGDQTDEGHRPKEPDDCREAQLADSTGQVQWHPCRRKSQRRHPAIAEDHQPAVAPSLSGNPVLRSPARSH
jgi:hypothetical protein